MNRIFLCVCVFSLMIGGCIVLFDLNMLVYSYVHGIMSFFSVFVLFIFRHFFCVVKQKKIDFVFELFLFSSFIIIFYHSNSTKDTHTYTRFVTFFTLHFCIFKLTATVTTNGMEQKRKKNTCILISLIQYIIIIIIFLDENWNFFKFHKTIYENRIRNCVAPRRIYYRSLCVCEY